MFCVSFASVLSEDLGPDNCTANVSLTSSSYTLEVPTGVVCIRCVLDNVVATDPTFQLNFEEINTTEQGRVVDDILVVYDTVAVFGSPLESNTVPVLSCSSSINTTYSEVFVESKSHKAFHTNWFHTCLPIYIEPFAMCKCNCYSGR